MDLTKEQKFGIISSVIFLVIFTGLLMIFGFRAPFPPPEEEGILINFGTNETGSGAVEPKPVKEPIAQEQSTPPPTQAEPAQSESAEEVLTQDFDEAAAIEAKKKKEKLEKKKRDEELERQRQEELERQQKEEEERRRKEEQRKAIENRAKNVFGGKNPDGDNTGEGETEGAGNQGKPEGDVNSNNREGGAAGGNGVSYSLSGRSASALPKPAYQSQAEGKVVVEVRVDQNGNVLSARPGVKGSTTSDKQLHEAAKKAALKAKFNVEKDAPAQQIGTITYSFILQ